MNTKFYSIKDGPDFNKCPLCENELQSCHLGCFCGKNECPYVDGYAFLTDKEAEKYKDLIG